MTENTSIIISNIYYMLTYAFRVLRQKNYENVAAEDFDYIQDLFAEIIVKGVSRQSKHGLYKTYVTETDSLTVLKGKINLKETIRNRFEKSCKMNCTYDDLTIDNMYNQILKSTILALLSSPQVKPLRKTSLKKLLVYFDGVSHLDTSRVDWKRISFRGCNREYEMLINICYLALEGLLQTEKDGQYKLATFTEDYLPALYEHFILEYYRQTFGCCLEVTASQIKWNVLDSENSYGISLLPGMQSDIMLKAADQTLIIDAKFYSRSLQSFHDKKSLVSGNVYQIYAYVKNYDVEHSGNVNGLLLYAKTTEDVFPDCRFNIDGNVIGADVIDLNCEFSLIKLKLDSIVEEFFGQSYAKPRE